MKERLKKISHRTGHLLASIASVFLLLVIVTLVGIQALAFWLNTDKGSDWLAAELTKAVEATPYQIELKNFDLHGLFGLGADSLVVSDENGPFVRLENVGIDLDIWPLPLKTAWINIDAEKADLLRIPESVDEETPQTDDSEFVMPERPDLYFTRLVTNLDVANLSLSDEVIEGGASFAIKGRQTLRLQKDGPALTGRFDFSDFGGDIAAYIPEHIEYEARGTWLESDFELVDFEINRDDAYQAEAKGLYAPTLNKIEMTAGGQVDQNMNSNLTAPLEFNLDMDGSLESYTGELALQGEVMNQGLELSTPITRSQDVIIFENISGDLADTDVSGRIEYLISSALLQGGIEIRFEDFDSIKAIADLEDISGSGFVNVNFDVVEGQQVYSGRADLKAIRYGTTYIETAVINAQPSQDFQTVKVDLDVKGRDQKDFTLTGNMSANISEQALTINSAVLKTAGGNVTASGFASIPGLDIQVTTKSLDLNNIPFVALDSDLPVKLQSANISIQGSASSPVIIADVRAIPTVEEPNNISLHMNTVYQNRNVDIDASAKGTGIRNLTAKAQFPASLSFYPFDFSFANDAPLAGALAGNLELQGLTQAFLPEGNSLNGLANLDATFAGNVSAPVLNGEIALQNGRFRNDENGVELQDIDARLRLSGNNILIDRMKTTDGGDGRLNISGNVNLENGFPPAVSLSANASHMQIMQGTQYQIGLNADLDMTTVADGGYLISGTVSPDEIVYTLPDRFDETIPELNIVDPNAEHSDPLLELIALDMIFDSKNQVFVRGWGLDVQVGGSLYINGTAENPDVRGNLSVVRGNYEEFGRRFDLAESRLRFQGTIPPSPYLDITAVTNVDDYDLKVLIRGTAEDPKITFASSPSMPEDQVLAYILFGKNVSQISPFQALQLASTLRKFSGKGAGIDPVGRLQQATGLDDLRIEGGTGEGVTVGAGKYLSDDVYLEVQQNSGDEGAGAARVEIELTPRITVESQVGSRGETGGGVFWEWDY